MNAVQARLIVRVLRDCSERPYSWSEDCKSHCLRIRERYEILKSDLGFAEAMEQAKAEWLMSNPTP